MKIVFYTTMYDFYMVNSEVVGTTLSLGAKEELTVIALDWQ